MFWLERLDVEIQTCSLLPASDDPLHNEAEILQAGQTVCHRRGRESPV